ncbi:MAG: endolytic transglycosylase MltG [Gemmatimonadales bacterium]|nr:endolytic transglycosylase MltG [Gemmatimonadales bacterium]
MPRARIAGGAFVTGVLVSGMLGGAVLATTACATDDQTPVTLTIRKGSSFREAAESLAAHDVVASARLFGFYASQRGRDRSIRYGTYLIRRGASWSEILTALQWGRGIVHRVTIPEGWPLWDIIPALSAGLSLPTESFESAVRDTALLRRVGVPRGVETLEGYLFPDTYDFPDGTTARQAVDVMVRRFEQVWKPEWDARLTEIRMTRHQVVTLASIVEKEVRKGDERPTVAAVYTNRLKARMMLQADPTVQYAMKVRPGRVLYSHLKVDSPYNTYRRYGLPPGPIASPGAASLEASLYPAKVPYRFFVAHPDGHHEFRTTYKEHLAAIEYVKKAAREAAAAATAARKAAERELAVDSALKAAGAPRATFDSLAARKPDGA